MRKHIATVAGALLAASASGPSAWAQSGTTLEEIRVTTENEKLAAGDVEIGTEQLDFHAPSKLSDVFFGETAVSSGGVIGTATKTYIHALEEENLSVTIDGVRQGGGGWHHTGNLLIDPELLQRATIKPGVAAADDGYAALSGSIAYETKDARDLLAPGQSLGGYAKLEWRSNGDALKETGAVYGTQGGMEFLLTGTLHNGDDYEDGDGNEVRYTAPDMYALLGKMAFNGKDGHRFELSFENTEDDGDRDLRQNFGTPVGAPPVAPNATVPSKTTRSTFVLSYADETPNEWITPSAQFSYNRTVFDTDQPDVLPTGVVIGPFTVDGTVDIHGETETFGAKLNGDIETGGGVVSVGVDFEHAESFGFAGSSVVRVAGPPVNLTVNTPGYREERRNLGAYAQARLKAGPMVGLSFGGRVDQQWFIGASGEKFNDAGLSGNATLEVTPTEWLLLSAGYSHVWGGYSFGEAGLLGFDNSTATGLPPDYTGFEATTSDNFRLGGEIEHNGAHFGAYLFKTNIYDANDKANVARGLNSDLETEGVDVKLGYRRQDGFITVKYTYTDVTDDGREPETTNYYLTSPGGHLFAIQAGYRPVERLMLGASAEIALEYDETEEIGLEALPAYEVFNLFASYEPEMLPGFSLRAEVNNLLDETYFDRSSEGSGQPTVSIPRNLPGRSFGLIGKVTF